MRDSGLKLSSAAFEADSQNDPKAVPEMTLRLLGMTVNTLGESFSKKRTLEKGELFLGENIGQGFSMEYEYFADRRGLADVFRLGKISLIKPNGDKVLLEKKPTSADGEKLTKKSFTEEDLGLQSLEERRPVTYLKNLQLPTVIQGELLTALMTWAPRMDFLTREELRNAGVLDGDLSLRMKASFRENTKYVGQIIKKQTFKYILFALVLYLYYAEKEQAVDIIHSLQDPWSSIEDRTNLVELKNAVSLLKAPAIIQLKRTPTVDLTTGLREIGALVKDERHSQGGPRLFLFDGVNFHELNIKKLNATLQDIAEGDQSLVVLLPKRERLLLVQGLDDDASKIRLFGVSAKNSPEMYRQFEKLLKTAVVTLIKQNH
jgi:hypothetical protein